MKTSFQPVSVSIPTTSAQILGPSDRRYGLIFSAPQANRYTIGFGAEAVLDQGLTIYPTQAGLLLTYNDVGDAVAQPITAISAVAAQDVSVTVILKRD